MSSLTNRRMTMTQPIPITTHFINTFEPPNGDRPALKNAQMKIIKCVNGYSSRTGFWGKIAGLIYRIWNAVKAIIGQSDWQRAKRAMENNNFHLIDANISHIEHLDRYLNLEYPNELTHVEDPDTLLHALIRLNESPIMKEILQIDRDDLSDEVKIAINERLVSYPNQTVVEKARIFKDLFKSEVIS